MRPALCALLGFLALLAGCAEEPESSPNLLLIVADDLGYGDLASFGGEGAGTPHLDALAREGVRFTRHYTESTCAPSRAALLTGRYPARLGFRPGARGISPQVPTLARTLREAGYSTHQLGKWHLGDVPAALPMQQGYDSWYGFQVPWLAGGEAGAGLRYRDPRLAEGSAPPERRPGHLTSLLTDRAVALVSSPDQDRPWFLELSYFAPHAPAEPAPEWASRHPDTPAGRHRALVEQLDAELGRLLAALEESGRAGDTLVVFVSDNGGEEPGFPNNAPFEGRKNSHFEGGVRTPLLLRWPGVLPAGAEVNAPAAIFDLFPTLVAAAGAPLPEGLDGRDLAPLAEGEVLPERMLFWEQYGPDERIPLLARGRYNYSALSADGRYRLVHKRRGQRWLLDLQADATGRANVLEAEPEVADWLALAWREWHGAERVLETRLETDPQGLRWLVGDDLQRVPGAGGFSLGVAVWPQAAPRGVEIIARQEGVYELSRAPSGLRFEISGAVLSGPSLAPGACAAIVATAYFHRSARAPETGYAVAELFVNGKKLAAGRPELRDEGSLSFGPTAIGHDGQGSARFDGRIAEPVLWNERAESAGPDYTPLASELSGELCPPPGAGA